MKANELMIRDWVYRPACYDQVKEIRQNGIIGLDNLRGIVTFNELDPIPLTQEILEKNGFELSVDFGNVYSLKESQRFWAVYVSEGVYALGCQSIDSSFANIRYVHQLQHALRLCGIEKEIEL